METWLIEKKKYNRDFDGFKWCIAAKSEDEMRKNICCVYVDCGVMIATDGHRIHLFVADWEETHDGLWEVVHNNGENIMLKRVNGEVYPDYERIFPDYLNYKSWPEYPEVDVWNPEKDTDLRLLTLIADQIFTRNKYVYNLKFLADAMPSTLAEQWTLKYDDSRKGELIITNKHMTKMAMIMPVKR